MRIIELLGTLNELLPCRVHRTNRNSEVTKYEVKGIQTSVEREERHLGR